MANTRILFVDDDERLLKGIVRQQGDDFDITTASGPMEALALLQNEGPFAVVVSDMRMPEMNGSQLLKRVRDISPDSVRMILTGFAELHTTIEAVNEGHIFRFLAKPCDEHVMSTSLQAGLRQYKLVEAERELLEGTLHGSVKVLADVLSLVSPLAFGQSTRVKATVDGILKRVPIQDQWQLEIAAMLSSLGCVTLPTDLLTRKLNGKPLPAEEQSQYDKHPELARDLIRSIPRMEEVSAIVAGQFRNGAPPQSNAVQRKSRILELALAFDFLELSSESPLHALNRLKSSGVLYEQDLLDALGEFVKHERNVQIQLLDISEVKEGMVIADDLFNSNGTLLMSKGQKVSPSALRVLQNFTKNNAIVDKIKVATAGDRCSGS